MPSITWLRRSLTRPGSTRGDSRAAAPLSTTITMEKLNTVREMMPVMSVLRTSRLLSASTNPGGSLSRRAEARLVDSNARTKTASTA